MTEPKSTELEVTQPQGALQVGEFNMTADQVALIKRTIAKDCTDDELKLFVHVCRRLRLDPIAKQIYAVKMDGKMVIQTGIDGMRLIAERTGRFRGSSDPEWCGEDGVWKEVWTDRSNVPSAARVRVRRSEDGNLEDAVIAGVANFWEYCATKDGKPNSRWTKAPAGMIAKCAEALALRRAFPNELAGLFTFDEMSSSYEKDAGGPKVALPMRKSERAPDKPAKREPAQSSVPPVVSNPWQGELDEIKASPSKDFWMISADAGLLTFFTNQLDIKDRAAGAISDAKQVRIEWKKTEVGNLEVQTLVLVMEA